MSNSFFFSDPGAQGVIYSESPLGVFKVPGYRVMTRITMCRKYHTFPHLRSAQDY